jgi:hypothetical protein
MATAYAIGTDNCPLVPSPDASDLNRNGVGDA